MAFDEQSAWRALKLARTLAERCEAVESALDAGISLHVIEAYLDHLDLHAVPTPGRSDGQTVHEKSSATRDLRVHRSAPNVPLEQPGVAADGATPNLPVDPVAGLVPLDMPLSPDDSPAESL